MAAPAQPLQQIESFWAREYALYLNEHRKDWTRRTHMVGIPLLVISAVWALVRLDWVVFVVGWTIGWTLQLIGHRIEGNRPALLKRPMSILTGQVLAAVEILHLLTGWQPGFARTAQAAVFGPDHAH